MSTEAASGIQPVIRARGLSKTYPGPPAVHALGPVDLMVARGDYLAIRGPSGSGKTTLLNLLGLLDTPSAGDYVLDGIDTRSLGENQRTALRGHRIGFVFQDYQLLDSLTPAENVALAELYTDTPRRSRLPRARDALARVGLADRADANAATLSGGEKQRVAIARALVGAPSLLLCDEPTGNLDSANAARILDVIDDLHASDVTIIVITHDETTSSRAARALFLHDGLFAIEENAHA